VETISNAKLRDCINDEINQQVVQDIANQMGKSVSETEQIVINLSININLLSEEIIAAIGDSVSLADIEDRVASDAFIDSIQVYEKQLKAYQENIEREAERAKKTSH